MAAPWLSDPISQPMGPFSVGPDPERVRRLQEEEARRQRDEQRSNAQLGLGLRGEQRQQGNDAFTHTSNLASAYNADPSVKAYRVAIGQLGQALNTGDGPQNDLALTYAFAKAMDPESVVRESEQNMVTESQPWFQTMTERIKKQFGMDGAGNYTPEARQALRVQISNAVAQRAKIYDARREYFGQQARAFGVDPSLVIGEHDAKPFVPAIEEWVKQSNGGGPGTLTPEQQRLYDAVLAANPNATPDQLRAIFQQTGLPTPENLDEIVRVRDRTGGVRSANDAIYRDAPANGGGYWQSPVSQGMSGVNEGIASTFGLPFDVAGAIDTGMTRGINALFGTDLKTQGEAYGGEPLGGSAWWQNRFGDAGFTGPPPNTQTGAFARRVGNSVGSAVVPVGGAGASLGKAALGLGAAAGGGVGAATAQQVFPGNPVAEFAGEVAGSGLTGAGFVNMARNARQQARNATIPTVPQLKQQAAGLYQRAEQQGRAASPALTRKLFQDMRRTLRQEGQLGPRGTITNADTSTSKAFNLIEQYAGKQMTPTEMQTVRTVIADGRNSADPADQRLAKVLLEQFDQWARPLVPDFDAARDIASRYLQAQDLEQARELAGVRAGQFTGSGYENALRTEYRALDRNTVKGRDWFTPDVQAAIRDVSRGTPGSNFARAAGRFAPTGPVSAGLGIGAPATVGALLGGPGGALAAGTAAAGIGTAGRVAATRMGINNAARAEMIARNGGPLKQVPMMDPETERLLLLASLGQLGQYVDPATAQNQPGGYYPNPFAGAENVAPRRGLFGGLR